MSIILGLDVSLNSPGWCRIDTENGARTLGTLDYSKYRDMERIAIAAQGLVDLCRQADMVIMEGLSMGLPARGGAAFMPRGRIDMIGLTYIVRMWLWKQRKETLLVPPTTVKKFATAKGNCQKNLMLREVSHRWGVEAADDNQADALALAEFGRAYLGNGDIRAPAIPEFQKACLSKAERLLDPAASSVKEAFSRYGDQAGCLIRVKPEVPR